LCGLGTTADPAVEGFTAGLVDDRGRWIGDKSTKSPDAMDGMFLDRIPHME
jgi:hypothetical protein